MINPIKKFIIILLILQVSYLHAQPSKDQKKIKQVYEGFTAAFKQMDVDVLMSYIDYSNNATMLLGTSLLKGDEIRQYYNSTISNLEKVDELDISNIVVTALSKKAALLHCDFKEMLSLKNGEKHYYEGAAMYYFEKEGQNWIIKHSSGSVKCLNQ